MPFVLDASTALAWHFRDEYSALAIAASNRSYGDRAIVPHHWALEVSSALLRGERRRRAEPADVDRFVERLEALDLETDVSSPEQVYAVLLPLARLHRLSVYDAAYLELAGRRAIPLATLDSSLAAAAGVLGVELVLGD